MKITARLIEKSRYNEYHVGCKLLTKEWQEVDVTDAELALIEASDIAEIKVEKKKPAKKTTTDQEG